MPLAGIMVTGTVIAYLLGGFPSGLVIGKGIFGVDIRKHGSGNIGMTNTMRVLGLGPGIAVLICDVAKGVVAVLVMKALMAHLAPGASTNMEDLSGLLAAIGAMTGHIKSPYLHFSGGKGVSTGAGAICVVMPLPGAIMVATFIVAVAASRIVSVATISATVALPVATALLMMPGHPVLLAFSLAVLAIILVSHRSNIQRLRNHTEKKLTMGHMRREDEGDEAQ